MKALRHFILALSLVCGSSLPAADLALEQGFAHPPEETKPWCYWYWISDNISKEGLTRDLEAMQRVGIGAALIGNIFLTEEYGAKVTPGAVRVLSPEWWDLVEHAIREGGRLGVDIGLFNCPGWSQSGGPWISATQTMRYLATSEIQVTGPQRFQGALPVPREPFQDVAVLAFPAPKLDADSLGARQPRVTTAPSAPGVEALTDGRLDTAFVFPDGAGRREQPFQIDFELAAPMTARTLELFPADRAFAADVELLAADDRGAFVSVRRFRCDWSNLSTATGFLPQAPETVTFPPVTARQFRLRFSDIAPGHREFRPTQGAALAEVQLSGAARLEAFVEKQLARMHPTPLPDWDTYLWPTPPEPDDRALVVPSARVQNLTSRLATNGVLRWDVPPGEWTILRFVRTVTGQITRPAPEPGLGFETDKYEAAALEAHLDHYVESLIREIGPRKKRGPGGLTTLHFDSWEMSAQNWSEHFRAEFQRRRGYDPLPFLPAYLGRIVDSVERTERFLWDVRQTGQELVIANHVGRLKARAKRHGLLYSNEPYDMNPTSDLSLGAVADVPMAEFWWHGFDTSYSVIEAASLGHTGGRRVVAAEAFTCAPGEDWRAYPGNIKALGDWAFASGINRLAFHRYQHQPWLDRWPGMRMGPYGVHWERTQTWWPMVGAYHEYLARCQLLLRQGEAVADILFLAAEGAPHIFRPPPPATIGTPPDRREYNFDGCAPDTLMTRATVKNGRIAFPGGTSYRLLVLPETGTMTPQLLRKVRELVRAGATVVGAPPQKSPSLVGFPKCDEEVRALTAELWNEGRRRVIWGPQFAKETDSPSSTAVYLDDAKWIWAEHGAADFSQPVGTVRFEREVVLPDDAAIAAAQMWITADNRYDLIVNGQSLGGGQNFNYVQVHDLVVLLRAGRNQITIVAGNDGDAPNPAGLVAALEVLLRDGRTLRWTSDRSWLARTEGEARPARELGPFGMAPWHRPQLAARSQHVEPMYPRYEALAELLRNLGVPPDFTADAPVRYTHRREGTTDIYFVGNRTDQPVTTTCWFRVAGRQPELWHPVTGERRTLTEFEIQEGRTAVPLRFAPQESYFLVFRQPARRGAGNAVNFASVESAQELSGPWQVQFGNAWSDPMNLTFERLEDWTQRPEPGLRHYSGIGTYRNTFDVPADSSLLARGARTFLDLGTVRHLARVRLNGRDLGVVWCAPWRVETTGALRPGRNELEIEVANLWINRLIGDAALPEAQRRTWTSVNPYAAGAPLVSSGLLGPVRLQRMDHPQAWPWAP